MADEKYNIPSPEDLENIHKRVQGLEGELGQLTQSVSKVNQAVKTASETIKTPSNMRYEMASSALGTNKEHLQEAQKNLQEYNHQLEEQKKIIQQLRAEQEKIQKADFVNPEELRQVTARLHNATIETGQLEQKISQTTKHISELSAQTPALQEQLNLAQKQYEARIQDYKLQQQQLILLQNAAREEQSRLLKKQKELQIERDLLKTKAAIRVQEELKTGKAPSAKYIQPGQMVPTKVKLNTDLQNNGERAHDYGGAHAGQFKRFTVTQIAGLLTHEFDNYEQIIKDSQARMTELEKTGLRSGNEYAELKRKVEEAKTAQENLRGSQIRGTGFHKVLELIEKNKIDPTSVTKKMLADWAQQYDEIGEWWKLDGKQDKKTGEFNFSDIQNKTQAMLKQYDAFKKELGIKGGASTEQSLGMLVNIGDEVIEIVGTLDAFFSKMGVLGDFKTSREVDVSKIGIQLNLLKTLLSANGMKASSIQKLQAFHMPFKGNNQGGHYDVRELTVDQVLDLIKQAVGISNGTLEKTQIPPLLKGKLESYDFTDKETGEIRHSWKINGNPLYTYDKNYQKAKTSENKQKIIDDFLVNAQTLEADDLNHLVNLIWTTKKYGEGLPKEGIESNEFYRQGPLWDLLRQLMPSGFNNILNNVKNNVIDASVGERDFVLEDGTKGNFATLGGAGVKEWAKVYRTASPELAEQIMDNLLRSLETALMNGDEELVHRFLGQLGRLDDEGKRVVQSDETYVDSKGETRHKWYTEQLDTVFDDFLKAFYNKLYTQELDANGNQISRYHRVAALDTSIGEEVGINERDKEENAVNEIENLQNNSDKLAEVFAEVNARIKDFLKMDFPQTAEEIKVFLDGFRSVLQEAYRLEEVTIMGAEGEYASSDANENRASRREGISASDNLGIIDNVNYALNVFLEKIRTIAEQTPDKTERQKIGDLVDYVGDLLPDKDGIKLTAKTGHRLGWLYGAAGEYDKALQDELVQINKDLPDNQKMSAAEYAKIRLNDAQYAQYQDSILFKQMIDIEKAGEGNYLKVLKEYAGMDPGKLSSDLGRAIQEAIIDLLNSFPSYFESTGIDLFRDDILGYDNDNSKVQERWSNRRVSEKLRGGDIIRRFDDGWEGGEEAIAKDYYPAETPRADEIHSQLDEVVQTNTGALENLTLVLKEKASAFFKSYKNINPLDETTSVAGALKSYDSYSQDTLLNIKDYLQAEAGLVSLGKKYGLSKRQGFATNNFDDTIRGTTGKALSEEDRDLYYELMDRQAAAREKIEYDPLGLERLDLARAQIRYQQGRKAAFNEGDNVDTARKMAVESFLRENPPVQELDYNHSNNKIPKKIKEVEEEVQEEVEKVVDEVVDEVVRNKKEQLKKETKKVKKDKNTKNTTTLNGHVILDGNGVIPEGYVEKALIEGNNGEQAARILQKKRIRREMDWGDYGDRLGFIRAKQAGPNNKETRQATSDELTRIIAQLHHKTDGSLDSVGQQQLQKAMEEIYGDKAKQDTKISTPKIVIEAGPITLDAKVGIEAHNDLVVNVSGDVKINGGHNGGSGGGGNGGGGGGQRPQKDPSDENLAEYLALLQKVHSIQEDIIKLDIEQESEENKGNKTQAQSLELRKQELKLAQDGLKTRMAQIEAVANFNEADKKRIHDAKARYGVSEDVLRPTYDSSHNLDNQIKNEKEFERLLQERLGLIKQIYTEEKKIADPNLSTEEKEKHQKVLDLLNQQKEALFQKIKALQVSGDMRPDITRGAIQQHYLDVQTEKAKIDAKGATSRGGSGGGETSSENTDLAEYLKLLQEIYKLKVDIHKLDMEQRAAERKQDKVQSDSLLQRKKELEAQKQLFEQQAGDILANSNFNSKEKKRISDKEAQNRVAYDAAVGSFDSKFNLDNQVANERELEGLLKKRLGYEQQIATEKKTISSSFSRKEKDTLRDVISMQQQEVGLIDEKIKKLIQSGDLRKDELTEILKQYQISQGLANAKAAATDHGSMSLFEKMKYDVQRSVTRVIDYGVSMRVLNSIPRGLQKIYQLTTQLEEAITSLRVVTGMNRQEAEATMITYQKLGRELGATTQEVAQSATTWLRQGYAIEEAGNLIDASMKLSKLGFMQADQATQVLTASLKGFKLEVSNAMDVVDKLTTMDQKAAVSAQGVSEALSLMANSARLAGLSIDEAIAMVSTVGEVTQQSMSTVGNAMKTMLARFGNVKAGTFSEMGEEGEETSENINDIEKVLGKLGIKIRSASGDMREFDDVLKDIAAQWGTLDSVSRNAVAGALGG